MPGRQPRARGRRRGPRRPTPSRWRPPTGGCPASGAARPASACSTPRSSCWPPRRGGRSRSPTSPGRRGPRRRPSTSTSATWSRRSGCWPRGWSTRRRSWPSWSGGDWSEEASWDTALTVTEGFLAYWEDNRAVFRVVDLATEEGDAQLRGIRVRALNAVTVALAQVIAAASPSPEGGPGAATSLAGRRRPDGRGRDAGGHVRQRVGPPLRLRVLGHPHPQPHRHPGPHAALGRHRPAGARRPRSQPREATPAAHRAGARRRHGAAARRRADAT